MNGEHPVNLNKNTCTKWFPHLIIALFRIFNGRKASRSNRTIILVIVATVWGVAGLAAQLLNRTQFRIVLPTLTIAFAVVWWAGVSVLESKPAVRRRLIVEGGVPILVWGIGLASLTLIAQVYWFHLLAAAWLVTTAWFVIMLVSKSWLIELRAGDVYYFNTFLSDPGEYQLMLGPSFDQDPGTTPTPSSQPETRTEKISVPRVKTWIRPLDNVWLLWNKGKSIRIDRCTHPIQDIITRDGIFNLKVKYYCAFHPEKMTSRLLQINELPTWRTFEKIEAFLVAVVNQEVELYTREFFKDSPLNTAITSGYWDFQKQFPVRVSEKTLPLYGAQIELWGIECLPEVVEKWRQDGAHSAFHQSKVKRDLAPLERLIDMVMIENVPIQLLALLAQLERGPKSRFQGMMSVGHLTDPDPQQQALYLRKRLLQEFSGEDDLKSFAKKIASEYLFTPLAEDTSPTGDEIPSEGQQDPTKPVIITPKSHRPRRTRDVIDHAHLGDSLR